MLTIKRKSLLYKSGVEYADFCVNHVEGCAHGCRFPCYAMMMKKRCGIIKDYQDWIKPKIVVNTMELLEKEIPKYRDKIKFVHLCFTSDPFMYGYPEVGDLSLKIIERFIQDDICTTVLTKGIYPKDLADTKKYGLKNEYGITLVSLDNKFKKNFEPFTASYQERINSLKYLHDEGLKTWISMEPYPTPNIVNQDLQKILKEVSFVDKIIFGKLNYNVDASQSGFRGSKEFYEAQANEVVDFCREHCIEYHIKFGTQKRGNEATGKIFVRNTMIIQKVMCAV